MNKAVCNVRLLSLVTMLTLLFVPLTLPAQTLIDISATAPAGFPADNAVLVGDHDRQPFFFWINNNLLSSYQLANDGTFTPYSFPTHPPLPSTLSQIKMASRSYWANILVFCGTNGNDLSFWAVRDRYEGFELTNLLTVAMPGSALPSFWVLPYGRFGFLVLWQGSSGLEGLLNGFDGTVQNLGTIVSGVLGVVDVKLVERSDLDSKQADLIVFSQKAGFDAYQAVHFDKFQMGSPLTIWQTPSTPAGSGFEAFCLESENQYLLTSVTGSVFTSIQVTNRQTGPPVKKDFGVPVTLSRKAGTNSPSAIVLSEQSGTQFWWQAVESGLTSDGFRQGLLPGAEAPAPLLAGPNGSWEYLANLSAGIATITLTFIQTSNSGADTTAIQSVPSQGLVWEIGEDPTKACLITLAPPADPGFLTYSSPTMTWINLPDPQPTGSDLSLQELFFAQRGVQSTPELWRIWSPNSLAPYAEIPWIVPGRAWNIDNLFILKKQALR